MQVIGNMAARESRKPGKQKGIPLARLRLAHLRRFESSVTDVSFACDTHHSAVRHRMGTFKGRCSSSSQLQKGCGPTAKEPKLLVVSRTRVAVAIGTALLWAATPLVACVLPCLAARPAKQECTRHMAMHCGPSMKSASGACCGTVSTAAVATVEQQVTPTLKSVLTVVALVTEASVSDPTSQRAPEAFAESPPGGSSPPSSISVLRI